MQQRIRHSRNYTGNLSVELVEGTPTHRVPSCAVVTGNVVTVPNGRFWPSDGGIQFVSSAYYFDWDEDQIRAIRDRQGNLLWSNGHHS